MQSDMPDQSFVTDHPSNREPVRPTVRLVLLRRKANIVLSAMTSTLFIATTKVAAFGRHHRRGGAAFGRATSFVVSFVVAMNREDVAALNTIFALRLSKTTRTVGRTDSRLDGRYTRTICRASVSDCTACHFPFIQFDFLTGPLWIQKQMASPHIGESLYRDIPI